MIENLIQFSILAGLVLLFNSILTYSCMRDKGNGEAVFLLVISDVIALVCFVGIYVNLAWLSPINCKVNL